MQILNSIKEATEEDLLAVIDLRREDETEEGKYEFNQALETLLSRHERYIYGTIHQVLKGMPGIFAEDIYWTVINRMVAVSGKFSIRSSEPERMRKQFLGWIGKIAAFVTKETLREMGTERTAENADVEKFLQTVDVGPRSESRLVSRVRQVMEEQLTEKEREAVRACILACPLDGRQGRMDKVDIAIACKMLDTSPENFRQLKSRAFRKLKSHLEPYLTN